jgi:hypothetical protein
VRVAPPAPPDATALVPAAQHPGAQATPPATRFSPRDLRTAGFVTIFLVALATLIVGLLLSSATRSAPEVSDGGTGGVVPSVSSGSARPTPRPSSSSGSADGATRQSPLPPGTLVQIPGWEVELLEHVRGEEANERVARANSNNDAPPDDKEYVLLFVRATSTEGQDQFAFSQSEVSLVGSRDIVYRGYGAVAPSPRLDSSEQIVPGGSVEGWAAYMVGKDEPDLVVILGDSMSTEAQLLSLTPGARVEPDGDAPTVAPNNLGADPREPAALGETAINGRWAITVTELLTGDAAWERILENYSGSDPPADGTQYVMAYVQARLLGDDDEADLLASSFFVGVSGDGEEVDHPVVLVPDPELFAILYPGGSTEGWVIVSVPTADPDALLAFRGVGISTGDRDEWRYVALD